MRENYCDGRTYEEHGAWLAGLSDDDRTIVYSPVGWRWTLVIASLTKRWVTENLPAAERLYLLEQLDKIASLGVTRAALVLVSPACAKAEKMGAEAKLNLDVFADFDVFREFARLNPSLLTALKLCGHGHV